MKSGPELKLNLKVPSFPQCIDQLQHDDLNNIYSHVHETKYDINGANCMTQRLTMLECLQKGLQPCKMTGLWSRQVGGTIGGVFFWEPDILPSGIWIVKIACKCLAPPQ